MVLDFLDAEAGQQLGVQAIDEEVRQLLLVGALR